MSLDKIQQLVGSLAKSMEDNQKLFTPVLAVKLAKCLDAYPHDQTLGAMSRVIEKMASNNTTFISRAELKSLYTKLHSRNTKFAELFSDELGIQQVEETPVDSYHRDDSTEVNSYQVGDPVLANALNSVFDKTIPVKMYSQALADKALRSVSSTLDSWNLRPSALGVVEGSDKFLVIRADYETPKGKTSFFVPVETSNNKVAEASVFMGNTGPQELNHTSIKSYLTNFAGQKLKIASSSILGVLVKSASENRQVSAAELALTRLHAKREGQSEFFQGSIVGQKVAEAAREDVKLPQSDEFASFEAKFSSPYGVASHNFGSDKVKIAREHIARELASNGFRNGQITVTGSDEGTIFYGVSLDAGKVAFTVPVKVANGKLSKPGLMLCNGSVSSFDKEGIDSLYVNNQTDFKVAAAASPLFGLKPSDLINNIRQAVKLGNHAMAEDALNVLAKAGDEKAYASGFQVYLQGLSGNKVEASQAGCAKLVKNSSSEHPICSHTGLPAHKVYQDKDGNCRPLYRRGMDETYEGATFINSKIFG
jgi:hypothetical protein